MANSLYTKSLAWDLSKITNDVAKDNKIHIVVKPSMLESKKADDDKHTACEMTPACTVEYCEYNQNPTELSTVSLLEQQRVRFV